MEIASAQNPKIKHLLQLQQKSQLRRKEGLFVVEGQRELEHCLAAGYEIDSLFVCEALFAASSGEFATALSSGECRVDSLEFATAVSSGECRVDSVEFATAKPSPDGTAVANSTLSTLNSTLKDKLYTLNSTLKDKLYTLNSTLKDKLYTLSSALYERIAYRGSTEGVIAIAKERRFTLDDLAERLYTPLPPAGGVGGGAASPLIIVLEGVEKPGNLGAVLRSADAAQADAVIVCDPLTDLYNPNLIRASLGAIFTVPTVACTSQECISFLQQHGISILTAQLQDSHLYYDTDMRRPVAIVMGTESTGLTTQWRQAATTHIRIPMLGRLDSLNVSVSAAILLFEAVRQRQTAS